MFHYLKGLLQVMYSLELLPVVKMLLVFTIWTKRFINWLRELIYTSNCGNVNRKVKYLINYLILTAVIFTL